MANKKRKIPRKRDALTADISADMAYIDEFLTTILRDPNSWEEFRQDPNGVSVRLGIHPPTVGRQ